MKKSLVLAIAVLLTVGIGYEVQKNQKADSHLNPAPSVGVSAPGDKDANQSVTGSAVPSNAGSSASNDSGNVPTVAPGQVGTNLNTGSDASSAGSAGNAPGNPAAGAVASGSHPSAVGTGNAGSANSVKNATSGNPGSSASGAGTALNAGAPGSAASAGGSASGSTSAAKSGTVATAPTPEKPKDNCFSYEYRHKKSAKTRDIEEFLDLTNAFAILHPNYNPDTLCVKVNSKPENFTTLKTKSGAEVRLGSVVGPESVIHVSYCVGKVTCKESCAAPKKRFMDDLMSDAGDEDTFNDSWGKGDDAHKKELKNKAKELRAVASESQNLNEGSVIREWDTLQKQEWVCKESQKRKEK